MQKLILILAVVLFSATAMAELKERQPEDMIADCVYTVYGNNAHYALAHFRGVLESQYGFGLRNAQKDYNEAKALVIQDKSSDTIGFYAAVATYLVNTIFQTETNKDGHAALTNVLTILNCNKKIKL